jgi:hypothetical protein
MSCGHQKPETAEPQSTVIEQRISAYRKQGADAG